MSAILALLLVVLSQATGSTAEVRPASVAPDRLTDREECFLKVICETKERIRYGRGSAWTPEQCAAIGHQFVTSARRHGLDPAFLAAESTHESDLREGISRTTIVERMTVIGTGRERLTTAHDVGLMGIHCTHEPIPVDSPRKWKDIVCRNGAVKKMTLAHVADPLDSVDRDGTVVPGNIELGARLLASLKKEVPILVKSHEHGREVRKVIPCPHRSHPWYAHYQWGSQAQGSSRFYGHSVASLYLALTEAMGSDAPEIVGLTLYIDIKGRARKADKPITSRHRELYARIIRCRGTCNRMAMMGTGKH